MKCFNKYKVLNIMSFLTLLVAFLLIIQIFYWELYPYKPLAIQKQPVDVVLKEVKQGKFLSLIVSYCKYMPISAEVTRSFINGLIYTTAPVVTTNEVGCRDAYSQILIPGELPEGVYYLRTTYRYKVNPIRTIDVVSISEPFKVIKND